jgi:hypothetical protein
MFISKPRHGPLEHDELPLLDPDELGELEPEELEAPLELE